MKQLAKQKKYRCLSDKYQNNPVYRLVYSKFHNIND
jgi:hypothetical protein